MTREELLAALLVERQTSPWWTTPAYEPEPDDEVTCRWRREIAEREHDRYETKRRTRSRKAA